MELNGQDDDVLLYHGVPGGDSCLPAVTIVVASFAVICQLASLKLLHKLCYCRISEARA